MDIKERVFERWVASGTDQTFEEWRESKRHVRRIVTGSMRNSFVVQNNRIFADRAILGIGMDPRLARLEQQLRQLQQPQGAQIAFRAFRGLFGLFG